MSPFTAKDWRNAAAHDGGGDTTTPLSAVAIEDLETRTTDYTDVHTAAFSVIDYGADPTGVADSTTAFANALAAGAGATVHIPAGTYKLVSVLEPESGTTIRGEGWSSLLVMSGNWAVPRYLFHCSGVTDVTFRDFATDGERSSKTSDEWRGIQTEDCERIRIINLRMADHGADAVRFYDNTVDSICVGCHFYRGGASGTGQGSGIDISTAAGSGTEVRNIVVANNTFKDIVDCAVGVHNGTEGVTIANNVIDGIGVGHGIDIAGAYRVAVTGNVIRCVDSSASVVTGILIHNNAAGGGTQALEHSITGNTLIGGGGTVAHGIAIAGSTAAPVSKLTITGNTVVGWPVNGFYSNDQLNLSVISNNAFVENDGQGLQFNQGASVVDRNTVTGNLIANNGGYGIHFAAAVTNNVVQNNLLYNNTSGATNTAEAQRLTNDWWGNIGAEAFTVSGSRGGNAALADLLTSLAAAGLIIDSSS
jgi:parallel beta-helix repeat protein